MKYFELVTISPPNKKDEIKFKEQVLGTPLFWNISKCQCKQVLWSSGCRAILLQPSFAPANELAV